jgi:hypothetical protein
MAALDRATLFELCEVGKTRDVYTREREGRTGVFMRSGYREFAAWVAEGEQRGLHVRSADPALPRSTAFRGKHNWVYVANATVEATPALIASSRRVSGQRGGGRPALTELDIYKPLAKAITGLPVTGLHAGGPRAKVLSGERDVATALCIACAARVIDTQREDEAELIAKLRKLLDKGGSHSVMYKAAHGDKRETESEALLALRNAVAAANAGSQSCNTYVTQTLVRTIKGLVERESAESAIAFAVELDELIMRHEFEAAYAHHRKGIAPAFERVLWRGADAKNFPAWWLVRLGVGSYGLLGKLGPRWTWTVADRDNTLATVPDALFARAVEIAVARDR